MGHGDHDRPGERFDQARYPPQASFAEHISAEFVENLIRDRFVDHLDRAEPYSGPGLLELAIPKFHGFICRKSATLVTFADGCDRQMSLALG